MCVCEREKENEYDAKWFYRIIRRFVPVCFKQSPCINLLGVWRERTCCGRRGRGSSVIKTHKS